MNEQQLFIKIGDKIKEIRLSQNMSQQDLAAKCNFEKANMSRIEAGRTNLTIKKYLQNKYCTRGKVKRAGRC